MNDRLVVVADHFRLPVNSVIALLGVPESMLRAPGLYLAPPNHVAAPITDYPRYPLGTPMIFGHGNCADDDYVYVLTEFDPQSLLLAEPEGGVRRSPTYLRYVEFARAGHQPPYITAFERFEPDGRRQIVTTSRQRTLVAQELAKPIQGWLGMENVETGCPLTLGDVRKAARALSNEPGHRQERTRSAGISV